MTPSLQLNPFAHSILSFYLETIATLLLSLLQHHPEHTHSILESAPTSQDNMKREHVALSSHSATLNSADRLYKIDQLREKNIGTHLPLPQLVAVGDQSSGKSSLLESLSGIPFPRAQNLCTRYATQITHRREEHSHINIGIIAGPNASDEDKERLSSYAREVNSTEELRAQFSGILDEVNAPSLWSLESKANCRSCCSLR